MFPLHRRMVFFPRCRLILTMDIVRRCIFVVEVLISYSVTLLSTAPYNYITKFISNLIIELFVFTSTFQFFGSGGKVKNIATIMLV